MERRQYRNPPIEEAVCEVAFAPGADWELLWPLRIYDALRQEYSGRPREESVYEAGVQSLSRAASITFQPRASKMQFVSSDDKSMAAVGRHVLSVHRLRPYAGWEDIERRLKGAFGAYVSVAKPVGIRRMGLRYINRIVIPQETIDLKEWFRAAIELPPGYPTMLTRFTSRSELLYDDRATKLIVTFASTAAPARSSGLLLDIDVLREWSKEPLPTADALKQVSELKAKHRVAFEGMLTEKTRALIDDEVRTE